MEKKLWSNAEVVELGVENTKSGGCSVNFDNVAEGYTDGVVIGCIWNPSKYERISRLNPICTHFDVCSPCGCALKKENLS